MSRRRFAGAPGRCLAVISPTGRGGLLPPVGALDRGPQPVGRYGPDMTGIRTRSRLNLPRYLREDDAFRTPVGHPDYRSTGLRAPLHTPVDLPHRRTEITGPLLGEGRVTAADAGRRPWTVSTPSARSSRAGSRT